MRTSIANLAPWAILLLLGAALANAAYGQGGLDRGGWDLSLTLIGVAATLAGLPSGTLPQPAPLGLLRWPLLLLPAYGILQIVPFPLGLVQALSPGRAALFSAATPFPAGERLVSLSVDPAATWDHVLRLTAYALTFVLAREAVCRVRASSWLLVIPLMLTGGLEAAWGLAQAGGSGGLAVARGSYSNRNHLAGLLEMILPFTVMYAAGGVRRASAGGAMRIFGGTALAALIFMALVRTLSRMGLIATVVSSLAVAGVAIRWRDMSGWRRGLAAGGALLIVLTVMWLLPAALLSRFANLSSGDISMGLRLRLWRTSLPLLRDFPLFGCGLGAYAAAVDRYKDVSLDFADHAHNDYLQYLIELGPVMWGLALFCVGLILVRLLRLARSALAGELQFLAIAAAWSLLAMLVHSFADFNLYIPANALVFAWVGGIAAGAIAAARQPPLRDGKRIVRPDRTPHGSLTVPLAGAALAVCAAISMNGAFSR